MSKVLLRKEAATAWITLSSEEDFNAFSKEMAREFSTVVREVVGDPEIRVVVLRGAGPIFSSGAHIKEMNEAADKRHFFDQLSNSIYDSLFTLRESSQIFIAAVHGKAVGVALPIALCCDLVWVAKGTELVPGYLNIGLFPNGGLTYLLPELLGSKRALELLLVEKHMRCEQAWQLGLISAVIDSSNFFEEVEARVHRLVSGPVRVYQKTKELVALQRNNAFREHLNLEKQALLASSEQEEFSQLLSKTLARMINH